MRRNASGTARNAGALRFWPHGVASARIAEAVLRDERLTVPIGAYNREFGVTLSLPSVIGRCGVLQILEPALSDDERQKLKTSAQTLKDALASLR